ncbi:hypothetical protein PFNF135_02507 [Plasmodium falciparum NF135/5.C10]|uniref:Uncharacterized protein n=1 Tax=Plasmodium falciparum NF135/5.C10 TaxID=1036726 RepID=W4IHX2_PLAFA|nr:hypothetical protein PFNF135_02507 [Plasmodium falciparum NF135/5.C10]
MINKYKKYTIQKLSENFICQLHFFKKIYFVHLFYRGITVFEKIYIFKYGLYIKIFFKKNVIIFKKYILHFIFIYSIGKINKNKDNI